MNKHVPASQETALRVDLAAAFRLAARFGWHESVANHFSAAVSEDGTHFLMNPRWRHFELVRASDLLLLDAGDEGVMARPDAPDESAWSIHGAVHRICPQVRVLLHCHPPYATALACLADPSMPAVDQNTARFFGRVAVDLGFQGLADDAAEGRRIAELIGEADVLMMGNHGISVQAATVAEAFEHLYYFERAAKTLILAMSTGRPLNVMEDDVAAKVAEGWHAVRNSAFAHFEQLKALLDVEDASWRD